MSILSIGIYEPGDEFIDDAIAVNANMVFLHDQALRLAAGIKARLPNIKIVGRPWLGNTDEQMAIINSGNARQWLYDHMSGLMDIYPQVDVWQFFNEVFSMGNIRSDVTGNPADDKPPDFEGLKRTMEAERGGCDACREHGALGDGFNGGPGTFPTLDPGDKAIQRWGRAGYWDPWIAEMRPMFTYPGFGYLGGHGYAADLPLRFRDGAEWYVCRPHLFIMALKSERIPVPPILITEFGHGGDWKRFLNEEQVIDDYTWYGAEVLKDPEIKSVFEFCVGDSGGWSNYDIHNTSIIPAMGAWNAAHPVAWEEPAGGGQPVAFEWKLAFAGYASAHPEVGQPITDLMYDDQGNAWQYSERGLLLSAKGLGWQIFWLPNAQYPLA